MPELVAQRSPSPAVEDRGAGPIGEPAEQLGAAQVATPARAVLLEHDAPAMAGGRVAGSRGGASDRGMAAISPTASAQDGVQLICDCEADPHGARRSRLGSPHDVCSVLSRLIR